MHVLESIRRSTGRLSLVLGLLVGCGGSTVPSAQSASAEVVRPTLPAPLLTLPEGAQWIVSAQPRRVLENPALRRLFDILLPPRRLEMWTARYVLSPNQVERLAIAGYPDGRLLVAEGDFDAFAVAKASADAMDAVETSDTAPTPRAVGLIGTSRYLIAAADRTHLVFGEDAPESWSTVVAFSDGRTPMLPTPAINAAAHRTQAAAQDAPLVLHVLAPLALPLDTPIGVVLAGERQLAVALASPHPATVDIWLAMSGEFPETIEDNLRAFAQSLANEPLGIALGIADALDSLRVEHQDGTVIAHARLPTDRLARGLETLFGADLWRLIKED